MIPAPTPATPHLRAFRIHSVGNDLQWDGNQCLVHCETLVSCCARLPGADTSYRRDPGDIHYAHQVHPRPEGPRVVSAQ